MRLPYLGLGLDHKAGSMTVPEEYVQTRSPFAKMKPLRAPLIVKETQVQTLTGRLQQQVGHPGFSVLTLLISEDSQAAKTSQTYRGDACNYLRI